MYAIVEIAGQQFKVEKQQEIFVHRLKGEAGSSVEFDKVLLVDQNGKVAVGTPNVDGILVKAKILEHLRGNKVIVFHKKRRKGYQKQNGHRQYLSKILIEDIVSGTKKAELKTEQKVETTPVEVKGELEKPVVKSKATAKEVEEKAARPVSRKPSSAVTAKPKAEAKSNIEKQAKTSEKSKPKEKKSKESKE